jgi:PPK2 family polyphosphate:nucleotide phosphotransferase
VTSAFALTPGHPVRLAQLPTTIAGLDEDEARASIERLSRDIVRYQTYLMAHETWGLLVLFQGMDAAGKDEAIQHVLTSLDLRGVSPEKFDSLSGDEHRQDFLRRASAALPLRGQVGIFNRSYYEQVVGDKVHPERLTVQGLPAEARKDIWTKRYRQIADFERYLVENGIQLLKFFMHVSREEQRRRLLERIDQPEGQWQFSFSDVEERRHWDHYMGVYDDALEQTTTPHAPWHVIPADAPWAARAAVARILLEKLSSFHSGFPEPTEEERQELDEARARLEADDGS